jgi:L-seryl-tRNA(Ser) seleniumtransferase
MLNRRSILKRLSALPFLAGVAGCDPARVHRSRRDNGAHRDYFKELGVRTFVNAAGTYTAMTASLMPDEVVDAMQYASRSFVMLDELQDKVGARIASLLKCEAATVTSGCFSAITLGLAGVLTGLDEKKTARLPHLEGSGMKTEVILQKAHNIGYNRALTNCGVRLVEVETAEELEAAINENTAMLWFLNANTYQGQITPEAFVALGKKHNVPTMNDCAADVPPVENLWKYTQMGFDLVCFSGGKAIKGPQSAGLLLGRKDLIAAARLNAPPRANIGRGMKVNKEEILGMLVALEGYLAKDHAREWQTWEARVAHIGEAIKPIAGVTTRVDVPPVANHTPTLMISWDTAQVRTSGDALKEAMRRGNPSIELAGGGPNSVNVTVWMLNPGQEQLVAARLREELTKAAT